jgi:hypothetical protein
LASGTWNLADRKCAKKRNNQKISKKRKKNSCVPSSGGVIIKYYTEYALSNVYGMCAEASVVADC